MLVWLKLFVVCLFLSKLLCCRTWPIPSDQETKQCTEILASIQGPARVILDGLALAATHEILPQLCRTTDVFLLLHSPPHTERGTPADIAQELYRQTAAALSIVHKVLVTSEAAKKEIQQLFHYTNIDVVMPGCDIAPKSIPSQQGRLLLVGNIIPRKGIVYIEALTQITHLPWSLRCAAALFESRICVWFKIVSRHIIYKIASLWLREIGPSLEREYANADIFVLATWHETYGMVFTEARVQASQSSQPKVGPLKKPF